VDIALALAFLGVRVFPCLPGAKTPAIFNNLNRATTDPVQITKWWTENPHYNIGIPTGELFVVDLDVKGKADGIAEWGRLCQEHGTAATTPLMVKTASGGRHVFYRSPTGLRSSAGKIGPGIDHRGFGGYVVAAGSVLDDGSRYEWIAGDEEIELGFLPELPDVPAWIVEKCKTVKVAAVTRPVDYAEDTPANLAKARRYIDGLIAKGKVPTNPGRDDACFKHAAMLRDFGLSYGAALAELERLCDAPGAELPDDDHPLGDIVSSAYRGNAQNAPGSKSTEADRAKWQGLAMQRSRSSVRNVQMLLPGRYPSWPLRSTAPPSSAEWVHLHLS
jgi:hypothetical protein